MNELASVMDAVASPVLASAEDGYYVYENEAARRFLGYERDEVLGKQLSDLIAYDPTVIMATCDRLRRQGHLSGRTRFWHADGSLREADVNIFRQDLADGTRVFVCLAHPLARVSAESFEDLVAGSDHGLSDSEIRLLHLIAEGFSDEQMAVVLGYSSHEVALQVQGVLAKMTVASRTEAVVRALKTGVIV